jgi:putative chitinase
MSWLQALVALLHKHDPQPPTNPQPKEEPPVVTALTEQQFRTLFPKAPINAHEHLNRAMARYKIDSNVRVAAFLAQISHESSGLTSVVENLNYSPAGLAATWPKRYRAANGMPNALAEQIARKPEQIANHTYSDRMGNGPASSGDGWKYVGRGYIQTTGKENYDKLSKATGINFVSVPALLEQP